MKSIVAAATIRIMKIAWITYLGTLIPSILAHPPCMQTWANIRCTTHARGYGSYMYTIILLFHDYNTCML